MSCDEGCGKEGSTETEGEDYASLDEMLICERLKSGDCGAWKYILEKVVDQEKRSSVNNRKRTDWHVPLESLISRLYDEMVGGHKLDAYQGTGSLVGWLRKYIRGYLNRENPENRHEVSLDAPTTDDEGDEVSTIMDVVSFKLSDYGRGYACGGGRRPDTPAGEKAHRAPVLQGTLAREQHAGVCDAPKDSIPDVFAGNHGKTGCKFRRQRGPDVCEGGQEDARGKGEV